MMMVMPSFALARERTGPVARSDEPTGESARPVGAANPRNSA